MTTNTGAEALALELLDQDSEDFRGHPLRMRNEDVAKLSQEEREERVRALLAWSRWLVEWVIEKEVTAQGKRLAGVCVLYSGGNDSTTLAHIFKNDATHAIHCNTGIGIERTREFVRETCESWGLPLIEEVPDEQDSYRALVLDQGFPGPGHHFKMYQRLKERGLRKARKRLVTNGRRERVVYLAGRRRDESARRQSVVSHERQGSVVYVSPLIFWTKLDMNTYRAMMGDVPRNEVSDTLHMSGECLCGSFAHAGELDEIGAFFPEVKAEIESLESEVLATGKHPAWRCRWGWGADQSAIRAALAAGATPNEVAEFFSRNGGGLLCSSCDARGGGFAQLSLLDEEGVL